MFTERKDRQSKREEGMEKDAALSIFNLKIKGYKVE